MKALHKIGRPGPSEGVELMRGPRGGPVRGYLQNCIPGLILSRLVQRRRAMWRMGTPGSLIVISAVASAVVLAVWMRL
jgi:hypothetical protein